MNPKEGTFFPWRLRDEQIVTQLFYGARGLMVSPTIPRSNQEPREDAWGQGRSVGWEWRWVMGFSLDVCRFAKRLAWNTEKMNNPIGKRMVSIEWFTFFLASEANMDDVLVTTVFRKTK